MGLGKKRVGSTNHNHHHHHHHHHHNFPIKRETSSPFHVFKKNSSQSKLLCLGIPSLWKENKNLMATALKGHGDQTSPQGGAVCAVSLYHWRSPSWVLQATNSRGASCRMAVTCRDSWELLGLQDFQLAPWEGWRSLETCGRQNSGVNSGTAPKTTERCAVQHAFDSALDCLWLWCPESTLPPQKYPKIPRYKILVISYQS